MGVEDSTTSFFTSPPGSACQSPCPHHLCCSHTGFWEILRHCAIWSGLSAFTWKVFTYNGPCPFPSLQYTLIHTSDYSLVITSI